MFFYNPCVRKWGLLLPPPDNSFHRLRAVPLPRRGRSLGMKNRRSVECRRARDARTPSTAAAVPLPRGGRSLGVENRRSVECRREIATVRCVCNAGLHHCNGQMYLQPSVAPPSPVGARIARPFIPAVITPLREDARRVIGATAKPLYPIDGKAAGLDRRSPQTSLLEGGGPPQRWKE